MHEGTVKKPSRTGIVKLAIPLVIAVIALLIYNFQSINSYQDMSQDVRTSMFKDPAVSALLLTYRDNQDIKELTINVRGVSGEIEKYRPEVIKFVCNSAFLSDALKVADSVDVNITASLRKKDKYLFVSVTPELCLGIR